MISTIRLVTGTPANPTNRRWPRCILWLVVLLAGLSFPCRGVAQREVSSSIPEDDCRLNTGPDADSNRLFESSVKYREAGQLSEALALLVADYQRVPSCITLGNIANLHYLMGHCEDAKALLRIIIAHPPLDVQSERFLGLRRQALVQVEQQCPDPPQSRQPAAPPDPAPMPNPVPPANRLSLVPGSSVSPALMTAKPASPLTLHREQRPVYRRWWLWTAVGGVVVLATSVGIGVGLYLREPAEPFGAKFPTGFSGTVF